MTYFIGSLIVCIAIVAIVLFKCIKIKSDYSTRIQEIICIGIFIMIVVIFQTLCNNEKWSMALFGLYFCATDWIMFVIAKFALVYTNNEKFEKFINYLFPVLIFDVFFMAMNVEKQYAFTVTRVQTAVGDFFKFVPNDLFLVHMAVVYFLIAYAILTLLIKGLKAPKTYKKKYLWLFFLVLVIVVWNGIIMFVGNTLDYSVYGYFLGAILFYYFALKYIPNEILNATIASLTHDAKDGIIIFDEVKCLYSNSAAKKYLRVEDEDGKERLVGMAKSTIFEDYFSDAFPKEDGKNEGKNVLLDESKDVVEFEYNYIENNQKYFYYILFKKLKNSDGDSIGSALIIYDNTEDKKDIEQKEYTASHDSLTDLLNKEYLFQAISEKLNAEPENKFILACSDITKFKLINDLFGERIADGMLVKEANEITRRFGEDCVYGRIAADRFAILMPRRIYDEKVLTEIANSINYVERDYAYTVKMSWGIYEVNDVTTPISVMCNRALGSINIIKDDYRIFVAYYNDDVIESAKREQELIAELDDAIERRDITIFLQPIVRPDGTVVGAEALARWIHPKKGMISPAEFIPIFEKNNLIVKLDLHIWEIACQRLRSWREEGKDWFISVNISTKDLYYLDVFDVFTKLVSRYKIPAEKIRLEITESAVIKDINMIISLITRLQRFGFVVEIDDFGSGYSSLNMLKDLTVDVLKIDMKFLSRADEDPISKEILRTVLELAKRLKMEVVTEGVETDAQVHFLEEAECDYIQGYYFSKPVPEGDFVKVVNEIQSKGQDNIE